MKRNNIIHFPIGNSPVHINYRLHGSLSIKEVERLKSRHEEQKNQLAGMHRGEYDQVKSVNIQLELSRLDQDYEKAIDTALHTIATGPRWLAHSTIRKVILEAWRFLHEREEIILYAVCVMSNHVHVILSCPDETPNLAIGKLMRRHKSFTAGQCNKIRNTVGQPFWAEKYFDRTVRDGTWLEVMWYLINNPVTAKMVGKWQDWPGTYVNPVYLSHFQY